MSVEHADAAAAESSTRMPRDDASADKALEGASACRSQCALPPAHKLQGSEVHTSLQGVIDLKSGTGHALALRPASRMRLTTVLRWLENARVLKRVMDFEDGSTNTSSHGACALKTGSDHAVERVEPSTTLHPSPSPTYSMQPCTAALELVGVVPSAELSNTHGLQDQSSCRYCLQSSAPQMRATIHVTSLSHPYPIPIPSLSHPARVPVLSCPIPIPISLRPIPNPIPVPVSHPYGILSRPPQN